jgi:hypothetical protein
VVANDALGADSAVPAAKAERPMAASKAVLVAADERRRRALSQVLSRQSGLVRKAERRQGIARGVLGHYGAVASPGG